MPPIEESIKFISNFGAQQSLKIASSTPKSYLISRLQQLSAKLFSWLGYPYTPHGLGNELLLHGLVLDHPKGGLAWKIQQFSARFFSWFGRPYSPNSSLDEATVKVDGYVREYLTQADDIQALQNLKRGLTHLKEAITRDDGSKKKLIRSLQTAVNAKIHSLQSAAGIKHEPKAPSVTVVEVPVSELPSLHQEISLVQPKDTIGSLNSWKKGLGATEKEQTLEAFVSLEVVQENAKIKKLMIYLLGKMSKAELGMFFVIKDYVEVLHNITAKMQGPIPLNERQRRGNQYAIEYQLPMSSGNCKPGRGFFNLSFTNEDIYLFNESSMNFVYGIGISKYACGLFSSNRMAATDPSLTLKRMMKVATHEFGHMRGITHCTNYYCCMQGANNALEMDNTPLLFCAQDMAKICHVSGMTLKEGYQRQLNFFKSFSYQGIIMNFSQEIQQLHQKISLL